MDPIASLMAALDDGTLTASQLVDDCLTRVEDPDGEGPRAFLTLNRTRAMAEAKVIDDARRSGHTVGLLAGVPLAVKDLFDVKGERTTAGSVVLSDRAIATQDSTAVARLRAAGAVALGRTNMTEFAYSGLGLNPHFPAPQAPWDRSKSDFRGNPEAGHIPGGSSSGSAVAVADGMSAIGLGTDTGGSLRIPAAFCGLVGFKPTAIRIPLDGAFPLSPSLDSIGAIGLTVQCCAIIDAVLADSSALSSAALSSAVLASTSLASATSLGPSSSPPSGIRLAALTDFVLEDLDPTVAAIYDQTLTYLSKSGIAIDEVSFPELLKLPDINRNGGLVAPEAFHRHRQLLADRQHQYDPTVLSRIEVGRSVSAAQYIDVLDARRHMMTSAALRMDGYDAFVLPTVATLPPTFKQFAEGGDDYYLRLNGLCLRNTSVANFLDTCAISLPVAPRGEPPVGLMLMGSPMGDRWLLSLASTIEAMLPNF